MCPVTNNEDNFKSKYEFNKPAVVATAGTVLATATVDATTVDKPFSNFQLTFWEDAQEKYQKYIVGSSCPDPAHMVLVVLSLAQSLVFLFGRHDKTKPTDWAPTLPAMAKGKPWLLNEKSSLYTKLNDLYEFYKDVLKHPTKAKVETDALALTKENVIEYRETTREVWRWFIQRYYDLYNNGVVPPKQWSGFQSD